jgi:WhiB family redox-sensing transcriptional regulator
LIIKGEDWHEDAECAKPQNKDKIENFFANKPSQQLDAKKLCNVCPVKKDCLKWALDNKQIWGIWGGLDPQKIRNTLSVNWDGQEMRYKRFPLCPNCGVKTSFLTTATVDRPDGGRWATMRIVICTKCNFTWQSRTSANAVDAYHTQKSKLDSNDSLGENLV